MFHLLFGPLVSPRRSDRLSELAAIGEKIGAASLLLNPDRNSSGDGALYLTGIGHEVTDLRRKLESRLARAGVHVVDPRLICEAASEMAQVMRLIGRVVRCRAWLRLEATPAEARELEAVAGQGVRLVAESARELTTSGAQLVEPEDAGSIKGRAEELYNRGVARSFAEFPDPLDVLRLKTLYDILLSVVIGSDRALEALRNVSYE